MRYVRDRRIFIVGGNSRRVHAIRINAHLPDYRVRMGLVPIPQLFMHAAMPRGHFETLRFGFFL